MKRALFLAIFMALVSICPGQDSLFYRYADVKYPIGGANSKATVAVDYGEVATGWGKVPNIISDKEGKSIKFKSPVDCLN
ncbi:MAG: hypothetical protein IPL65_15780 [Lewinellaceae bacterium]|nr:hypothetical protein [Lewinellaceae bacterium]MBK8557132.1 hypothetical protein [Lewinellaceae bacterium]